MINALWTLYDLQQKGVKSIYSSLVAKKSNVTTGHCSKTMEFFIERGMVTKQKIGRTAQLHLTDKGKFIAERFRDIENAI